MNPKFHTYFMDVAKRTAELSYARRLKVGSVAVRDRRIIACGYNGTPPGEDNNCEITLPSGGLKTKDSVVHSEVNLIRFAKSQSIDLSGCTLYITHRPCFNCSNEIFEAGFDEVIFDIEYELGNNDGVEFLKNNLIEVVKLSEII